MGPRITRPSAATRSTTRAPTARPPATSRSATGSSPRSRAPRRERCRRDRSRALGRDRAAVPAGGARPLLPGADPGRRDERRAGARLRRAAREARRRPHALRLLLRLLALRPALRLPALRAALAGTVRPRCARSTSGRVTLLAAVDAPGFRELPARDGEHDLRPQRPRHAARAAAARRAARPRRSRSPTTPRPTSRGCRTTSSVSYVAMAFLREAPAARPRLAAHGAAAARGRARRTRRPSAPRRGRGSCDWRAPRSRRSSGARTISRASWRPFPAGREQEQRGRASSSRSAARTPPRSSALGKLRGCIGQPQPTFPLYYGTVQAALDAAAARPALRAGAAPPSCRGSSSRSRCSRRAARSPRIARS